MPFSNEVIGTNGALIRNWMKSENYIAGVSGWQIKKDGSAEFNNGTFRGSIEVGPNPGQHYIVNNPSTSDIIDIYDSSNRLIYQLARNGLTQIFSPGTPNNPTVNIGFGGVGFADSLVVQDGEVTIGEGPGFTELRVSSPILAAGTGNSMDLELISESSGKSYVIANQRNVVGTLVQMDGINQKQLVHTGTYSITTDGSGNSTFSHNCSFTPALGFLVANSIAGSDFYQYVWLNPPFNSSTASAHFANNVGAAKVSTTFTAFGLFFG